MPIIKSAKKALRQTKSRTARNQKNKLAYKVDLRAVKKTKKSAGLVKLFSSVDKAAKKGVIHKNKAARIKSRASKLV